MEDIASMTAAEDIPTTRDVDENKGMAIAACFIFFLPLLTDAKYSPFAMHWANQSLLRLFVHMGAMFLIFIPILGWLAIPFVHLFGIILFFMSIVRASRGQMTPLPLIGSYTIIRPSQRMA